MTSTISLGSWGFDVEVSFVSLEASLSSREIPRFTFLSVSSLGEYDLRYRLLHNLESSKHDNDEEKTKRS
jgi:hypothetical protein